MSKLARGLVLSAAAGAAIYVGVAAWAGFRTVGERLSSFAWPAAAAAAGLAALNYLLRFAKWEIYLARLGVRVPRGRSLAIFLSGFSLTVTPGKVGEVLKSYLLRETDGVPMARTAPIVVAERVTDLVALLLLALLGADALGGGKRILVVGAIFVGALILVVAVEPIGSAAIGLVGRLPVGRRIEPRLREFYASSRTLLGPVPLLATTAISALAWACECLAFYLVVRGFPNAALPLLPCVFIYAAMTVAGALSFLPGGLGVQEAGMIALLVEMGRGIDHPTAAAATFVTRVCTLWFAVLVGIVALAFVRRRTAVDVAQLKSADSG